MMLAAETASHWPSDAVWLSLLVIVSSIVQEIIARTRNAATVTKVDEVAVKLVKQDETLAKQDEKAQEQGEALAKLVTQSDGLLEKVGDIREKQGKLLGAEEERMKQVEIALAVKEAAGVQPPETQGPVATPTSVKIVNPSPIPVTETRHSN